MKLYLTVSAPVELAFSPEEVQLQIRGERGEFLLDRLDEPEFIFRTELVEGRSIGLSAERAMRIDPAFDSLVSLVRDGLAVAIIEPIRGGAS